MRSIAAIAGTVLIFAFNSARADFFQIVLNENGKYYRNSGTIVLYDPLEENKVLGTYRFVSGGAGKGSLPFGTYQLGSFRDDPGTSFIRDSKEFRRRWMIKHVGLADGEAYENKAKRELLELHSIHARGVTAGCLGVLGSPEVWDDFVQKLQYVHRSLGTVTFEIAANPEGTQVASMTKGLFPIFNAPPAKELKKHKKSKSKLVLEKSKGKTKWKSRKRK